MVGLSEALDAVDMTLYLWNPEAAATFVFFLFWRLETGSRYGAWLALNSWRSLCLSLPPLCGVTGMATRPVHCSLHCGGENDRESVCSSSSSCNFFRCCFPPALVGATGDPPRGADSVMILSNRSALGPHCTG